MEPAVSVSTSHVDHPSSSEQTGSQNLILGALCWVWRLILFVLSCFWNCLQGEVSSETQATEVVRPSSTRPHAPKRHPSHCLVQFHTGGMTLDIRGNPSQRERITAEYCALHASEDWLEAQHAYIQWMLPTATPSQPLPQAPILDAPTVQALTNNPRNLKYMQLITWKLLCMWGIEAIPLSEAEEQTDLHGLFSWRSPRKWQWERCDDTRRLLHFHERPSGWKVRLVDVSRAQEYLTPSRHSVLRMSRLMESHILLGDQLLADKILETLKTAASDYPDLKWNEKLGPRQSSQIEKWQTTHATALGHRRSLEIEIDPLDSEGEIE